MAYDKQTWTDNETLINAERMNHIEDGISSASDDASEALATAQEAKDTAITAITVNGEDVPVEDNKAEITVSGTEPTVEDETLIF